MIVVRGSVAGPMPTRGERIGRDRHHEPGQFTVESLRASRDSFNDSAIGTNTNRAASHERTCAAARCVWNEVVIRVRGLGSAPGPAGVRTATEPTGLGDRPDL